MNQPLAQQPNTTILSPAPIVPTLQKWFGDKVVEAWRTPPNRTHWLTMGCLIYGESYVDTFCRLTLPTMLAPNNFEALRGSYLLIFTDAQGFARIQLATKDFDLFGIEVVMDLIPDPVMEVIRQHPSNRYWVLGAAHNIEIRWAQRFGTGYHMLAPDHLYGWRYFKSLKRLAQQHQAIVQTGISADIQGAAPELLGWGHIQGWIEVPDRDLGSIGARHMHAQTRGYLMNGASIPDKLPWSHYLCWRGSDALHSYCCHMNPAWLAPHLVRDAPNFLPATLDTRLPYIVKDGPFYVPTPADEMTFIEVSDRSKAASEQLVDADNFLARAWAQAGFSEAYMRYFLQPSLTPTHPQKDFFADDMIATQHKQVVDLLLSQKPPRWMALLQQQMQF